MITFSTCNNNQNTCYSSFALFMEDSSTVTFSGQGIQTNPMKAHVNLSKDVGNLVTIRQDGLYVSNQIQTILSILDSPSIDFSGDGKPATPLTGIVKISANPINTLMLNTDGLYVAPTSVEISPDEGNTLEERSNGLYAGGGGQGGCAMEVTYAELLDMLNTDALTPGCQYIILDYRTVDDRLFLQYNGSNILTSFNGDQYQGNIDPLLVTASDVDELSPSAIAINSGHQIEYNVNGGEYGRIERRISNALNIDLPMDWLVVDYRYSNINAGGSIDRIYKVFNGTDDFNTSGFTRITNGIYIGRQEYGNIPKVIFGGTGVNAAHYNVTGHNGEFFICNSAKNLSKGQFTYRDITVDLNGDNDYIAPSPVVTGTWTPTLLTGVENPDWIISSISNATYNIINNMVWMQASITLEKVANTSSSPVIILDHNSFPAPMFIPAGQRQFGDGLDPNTQFIILQYGNDDLAITNSWIVSASIGALHPIKFYAQYSLY